MNLSVWRSGVEIHRSEGHIPAGMLMSGDIIHLGAGAWKTEELNWIPVVEPNITITSLDPFGNTAEQMVESSAHATRDICWACVFDAGDYEHICPGSKNPHIGYRAAF